MSDTETRTIALSRRKMVFPLVACLAIVAVGLWILTLDDAFIEQGQRFTNPTFVHGIGVASIAVFGFFLVLTARRFFDTRPGLVLDSAGMVDNSSGIGAGFIPWSDIVGLDVHQPYKQKMLVVKVANPDKYIETGNALTRYLRRSINKSYGSPITINNAVLPVGFDEMSAAVRDYFSRYGGAG